MTDAPTPVVLRVARDLGIRHETLIEALQKHGLVPDQGSSAARIPTEGVTASGDEIDPLAIAYGCLWRTFSTAQQLHNARNAIGNFIGPDRRARGVRWAVENLPSVTEDEIGGLDI